jgi:hypothetical protein
MENQKSRKITTADGTIMHTFNGKLHNWEGPALIPEGNNRKREYYLNGIKMRKLNGMKLLKVEMDYLGIKGRALVFNT